MRPRQPPPRLWLMTDERMGEALSPALDRLPRGAGVVFRHHATPPGERRALFDRVRAIARRRGLLLVLAGPVAVATRWRADGAHGPQTRRPVRRMLLTRSAHDARELAAAARAGADVAFLSPVWPTRSHPGSRPLGRVRFGLAMRSASLPVVALGGMTARRARRLPAGAYGWSAIDAWLDRRAAGTRPGDQKRKAVPR